MGSPGWYCIFLFFFLLSSHSARHGVNAAPASQERQQEYDKIKSLPGQPPVSFAQYSGYITVDKKHGRALFYWLTEAAIDPTAKPLVLWLNGGPGCSSIAFGASAEVGPFRIKKNGSALYLNKYSWNREANILFLESPAGVGFSYTNTSSDLAGFGDERTGKFTSLLILSVYKRFTLIIFIINVLPYIVTKSSASDSLTFLLGWLTRFPRYKHRDFYIAGESYAGHYIPQLAKKVHDYNKVTKSNLINLKGFLVGNPVMDSNYDNIGTVNYWWSHALISDATYKSILKFCNFSRPADRTEKCNDIIEHAATHDFGNINPYSIYTPSCPTSSKSRLSGILLKNTLIGSPTYGYDPCSENYAVQYYNRLDVQRAMHANTSGIPYKWTTCSEVLTQWKDSQVSMLPTYRELIKAGLRIWVFSGDADSVVPVTATRFSLSHLGLPVKIPWYPWYSDGQVGGWTEVYQGLTFATVRGAGHQVPTFQAKRAFSLFKSFLAGRTLAGVGMAEGGRP
ncbi:serine carboxypeptidase 24-like isoform X1 [Nymphaea colorata]|nr:serine carboxypeptidase 24-like isoform X1 [Nymphaea colorata]